MPLAAFLFLIGRTPLLMGSVVSDETAAAASPSTLPSSPSPPPRLGSSRPKMLGEFHILKHLGSGASATVKLAIHPNTHRQVAIKIREKAVLLKDPEQDMLWKKEIAIAKLLFGHPNILKIGEAFETGTQSCVTLQHAAGGELFDHITTLGRCLPKLALRYLSQIASAVLCGHRLGITHRDLKAENLLLNATKTQILLSDFGLSSYRPSGGLFRKSCGSPHYASPEVFRGGKTYQGPPADVWSIGVLLYAMITGSLPFAHKDLRILLRLIEEGKYEMPDEVDSDIADLIRQLLQVDPERRMQLKDLWKHPAMIKQGLREVQIPCRRDQAIASLYKKQSLYMEGHYNPQFDWRFVQDILSLNSSHIVVCQSEEEQKMEIASTFRGFFASSLSRASTPARFPPESLVFYEMFALQHEEQQSPEVLALRDPSQYTPEWYRWCAKMPHIIVPPFSPPMPCPPPISSEDSLPLAVTVPSLSLTSLSIIRSPCSESSSCASPLDTFESESESTFPRASTPESPSSFPVEDPPFPVWKGSVLSILTGSKDYEPSLPLGLLLPSREAECECPLRWIEVPIPSLASPVNGFDS